MRLNRQETGQFVEGVADGSVSIEDATSWLKAVHQHGMRTEDTVVLTKSMIASGASLSWGEGPPVVDKHSTGGVGDKMSLVLAPALAAAGCRVPMLAGEDWATREEPSTSWKPFLDSTVHFHPKPWSKPSMRSDVASPSKTTPLPLRTGIVRHSRRHAHD